jgi:hypothetical protein
VFVVAARIICLVGVAAAIGWFSGRPDAESKAAGGTDLNAKLSSVARAANSILPKDMGHGVVMQSIRADGTTLVLAIDGLPQWQPSLTDAEMAKVMATSACDHPGFRSMVDKGAKIRIDPKSPSGETLPSLSIDHCA